MIIVDEHNNRYNIDLKISGNNYMTCPKCSNERTKKHDKCFSFHAEKGVGFCHHCQVSFHKYIEKKEKAYIRPEWKNKTELSDNTVKWFESRKISQGILKKAKITESQEFFGKDKKAAINFNYFKDGELVNVKYRSPDKDFKMVKDAEPIMYNLDCVVPCEYIIITEGEIDALSYMESGIDCVVSVPNGASKGRNNLEYLDNCIEWFDDKEIYLALDNDIPGKSLRGELIRRFGAERCWDINFDDCKDANEYLARYGKERLRMTVDNVIGVPVDGIIEAKDVKRELDILQIDGLQCGYRLGFEELDNLITWEVGRLCIITGTPGSGKSEFLDNIIELLNIRYRMKFGLFSPENYPIELHISKLIEKLTGQKFGPENKYYDECVDYINDNFFWISPKDESYSLEMILDKARFLVRKMGISGLVIDPWNRLEYQVPRGMSETNYISLQMTKIQNFAQKYKVLVFLVAHPRKIDRKSDGTFEVPTLYDISGSAHFYNKTDYGITIHRNYTEDIRENTTDVHVKKVKFKHLGYAGVAQFKYNINNGRFAPNSLEIDWDNNCHIYGIKKINEENELPF